MTRLRPTLARASAIAAVVFLASLIGAVWVDDLGATVLCLRVACTALAVAVTASLAWLVVSVAEC